MKIKTYQTNKDWALVTPLPPGARRDEASDPAKAEIARVLSELMRADNVVILTGLGTSMCVKDGAKPRAPTMAALWDAVRLKSAKTDADWTALLDSVKHPTSNKNLETLLSQCKLAEAFSGAQSVTEFIKLAEEVIRTQVDFLKDIDTLPFHVQLLRRIGRRGARKPRAKLFTTNYDLCFEQAAQAGRFILIDGFSPSYPFAFDPVNFSYDIVRREAGSDHHEFVPNVIQFYKLHGSLNWTDAPGEVRKVYPCDKPLLIYPRNSKYELAFAQPYLEMMSALQASLRESNTGLLLLGFGFSDNHIAEPVMSAIRSNLGLKVVVVDPALAASGADLGLAATNEHVKGIAKMIDHGDARLALLNATFEDVSAQLPDLTADTDLEKHAQRMKLIGATA